MHHIYHTTGIVVGSRPSGEADKMLSIYTRELGMVFAHARSIRKIESKLRFGLVDYSLSHIDLVRGRDMWRLTSAEPIRSLMPNESVRQEILLNVIRLLKKLCAGEAANEALFQDLIDGLALLSDHKDEETLKNLEFLLVLRMLYHSGYIAKDSINDSFIISPLSPILVSEVHPVRKELLAVINKSIKETDI